MSYSLEVYGPRVAPVDEVARLVERTGCRVVVAGGVVQGWTVSDGLGFDVNPAVTVDQEELPEGVTFETDEVWLVVVDVNTDGGEQGEQCGRLLAEAMGGVVVIEDEIWPAPVTPVAASPKRVETPARELRLRWFGFRREGDNPVRQFLDECQRLYPGALPRRYGEDWPYRYKFSDGGVTKMEARCDQSDGYALMFNCSAYPFSDGVVTTARAVHSAGGMWQICLHGVADAFTDQSRRDSLRMLFTSIAKSVEAVYAYAEVAGGYVWDGRELHSHGHDAERYPPVWSSGVGRKQPVGGLLGITPYPTWWSWFGSEYRTLLDEWLTRQAQRGRASESGQGVLVQFCDEPATRAQLQNPVSRYLRMGWVPSKFVSRREHAARVRVSR